MKEAYLYDALEDLKVRCRLCHHNCLIADGRRGLCGVRENRAGVLYSLVYDKLIAAHCDPIEKKPLFHFLPASRSYSVATVGCNFRCRFCQNADISQMPADAHQIQGEAVPPARIVAEAQRQGARSIAYTYTEPTVYFELARDTAEQAAAAGLRNVFVSNGYMSADCLEMIHPLLHGANVDLKAFSEQFYHEQCGARLAPVLETIAHMHALGIWLEVTTLLIPGLNDGDAELKDLAEFLAGLDPGIPWHISRFHPTYLLLDAPPTPTERITRARAIGREAGLHYVYSGNLPGDPGEKTFCHACGELLIDRWGFTVRANHLAQARCPRCEARIPGVWE